MADLNVYDAVREAIANSNREWKRCNVDIQMFFDELGARGYHVEETAEVRREQLEGVNRRGNDSNWAYVCGVELPWASNVHPFE
jgi:hypothetical protein